MSNKDVSIRHKNVQNIPDIRIIVQLHVILHRQIRQMKKQ